MDAAEIKYKNMYYSHMPNPKLLTRDHYRRHTHVKMNWELVPTQLKKVSRTLFIHHVEDI